MTTKQTIQAFLDLPHEALPGAVWIEALGETGSPWPHLQDYVLPYDQQRYNHMGEIISLQAARDEWRDGVTVTLK